VIVTDDCGCGELIKETEAGILFTTAMWPALEKPSDLHWSTRMSIGRWLREARRRYVEKRLAWKSVEKQVEKTYEGCYWRSI
jgi:glycosyltransferase involved in cell wall biosynthesis